MSQWLVEGGVAVLVILRLLDMIAPIVKRAGKSNGEPRDLREALVRLTALTDGIGGHVKVIDTNGTVAYQKHDSAQLVILAGVDKALERHSREIDNNRNLIHDGVLPQLNKIGGDFQAHIERHKADVEAIKGGK